MMLRMVIMLSYEPIPQVPRGAVGVSLALCIPMEHQSPPATKDNMQTLNTCLITHIYRFSTAN